LNLKHRLENHLTQIARERDPYLASAGHFFVQEYIHQEFAQSGSVEIHTFHVKGKAFNNIILNLPPDSSSTHNKKRDLPPILIGAHYDAVPGTPGADDNATGVAVLLELARVFAAKPMRYPVRLVAFDMEEYGLIGPSGASEYAAKLREQQQPLRLMISLEMLGYWDNTPGSQRYPAFLGRFYPNSGNFIALLGNLRTIPDLIHLSRNIRQSGIASEWLPVPNKGLILPQTRLSDHAHFWDQGYPAMMITDTAFLRNPHYHKPCDTIATLNFDFLTGVCQGLEIGLRKM
jgi:Zn-dependent M28 family amino/carboxypeptidase